MGGGGRGPEATAWMEDLMAGGPVQLQIPSGSNVQEALNALMDDIAAGGTGAGVMRRMGISAAPGGAPSR